jgi:hypothetical protein
MFVPEPLCDRYNGAPWTSLRIWRLVPRRGGGIGQSGDFRCRRKWGHEHRWEHRYLLQVPDDLRYINILVIDLTFAGSRVIFCRNACCVGGQNGVPWCERVYTYPVCRLTLYQCSRRTCIRFGNEWLSEPLCNGRPNGKSGVHDAELQEEKVVVSSRRSSLSRQQLGCAPC